jgi:hypothetical protein
MYESEVDSFSYMMCHYAYYLIFINCEAVLYIFTEFTTLVRLSPIGYQ